MPKYKKVSFNTPKLNPSNPSKMGIILSRLKKKSKKIGFTCSIMRKTYNIEDEVDILSEREVRTDDQNLSSSNIGSQAYLAKTEVKSNIDGYSQSDIWERESHGYLENSRKLLGRLKKDLDNDSGKNALAYELEFQRVKHKSNLKKIPLSMAPQLIRVNMRNFGTRRKNGSQIKDKVKESEISEFKMDKLNYEESVLIRKIGVLNPTQAKSNQNFNSISIKSQPMKRIVKEEMNDYQKNEKEASFEVKGEINLISCNQEKHPGKDSHPLKRTKYRRNKYFSKLKSKFLMF